MSDPPPDRPASESERPTEGNYQRLVESLSTHAIFELDVDGTITTWSRPAQTMYGYDADAVRGESVEILFAAEPDLDQPLSDVLNAARDQTMPAECWHEHADGSVFWGTLTLEPLFDDEIHTGFSAVSQDTTDNKQYERMLERQNDRLKEFTDILAHDLRSPLNVIDGRLELYDETGDHEHIEAVEETTERMERLVDDLLRVARQGNVVTDPAPTDIKTVIETAWAGVDVENGGSSLQYESVGGVSADEDRLCELFENLFHNAVEHGGSGVTVTVGPMEDGFYVADDGPGISPNLRAEVFDHGVSTSDDGSGYGLSIVRTIASAHGWDVVVAESETGGARFEFTGIEPID